MIIRKTTEDDIPAVVKIYADARRFMIENGNPLQWKNGGPDAETVRQDVERGVGYVCEDGGEIVAAFMFYIGEDDTYSKIYDGNWLDDEPYAVIHRIAVAKHGRGIAAFCFSECFKRFPNLKIDTHTDNLPMQRALARAGFCRCGKIFLKNGEERIAYQMNKHSLERKTT